MTKKAVEMQRWRGEHHSDSKVPISLTSSIPGFPAATPSAWAFFEILRGMRGDRPPLGGLASDTLTVKASPAQVLETLQSSGRWDGHWVQDEIMLLTDADSVIEVSARRRSEGLSQVHVEARSTTPARARDVIGQVRELLPSCRAARGFIVSWTFRGPREELQSVSVEEHLESAIHDAAYPTLQDGVEAFIEGYLGSPECVLVIQGAPGTGKTQLIRAIGASMSKRKGRSADVLYANDASVLHSDELYVRFAVGESDVLVIEDADEQLMTRSRGNPELHRLLSVSDGVIRAQGRKIIFSTNLPNIRDIDDALIRPGRCYASLRLRPLTSAEAEKLLLRICADERHAGRARQRWQADATASLTLAKLYRDTRETAG